jgi:tetratricopeptide (TPR) repeat protein
MRLLSIILLMLCTTGIAMAQSVRGSASVVDAQGAVEARSGPQASWIRVQANQVLQPGQSLRTGPRARVALLLSDRTQVRLNENTQVEILAIEAAPRSAGQTKFRQMRGQAWVQSKTPPQSLQWETPTAIAGIRGTDWEMRVAEDGTSVLSVFSGAIAFANDFGKVDVAANEQARVEPGKAPVKMVVRNLKDRVQWVSAYRLDPLRQIALEDADPTLLRQALAAMGGADAAAQTRRGRIFADLGQWTEAEAAFNAALKAEPGQRPAQLGMAYAAVRRGDLAGADAWLAKARGDAPDADWLLTEATRRLAGGEIEAGLAALQGLDARVDAWLLRADVLAYEGRGADEIELLGQALNRFPDEPRLLAALARANLRADRLDAAKVAADKATQANLASYEGWLAQAEIARREGDATATLGAYDIAIALKPADDRAWFGRGEAQGERDYLAAARADLAQAVALKPDGLGYQGAQGGVATQAERYDEAEAAYRQALEANPGDYVALTGLGLLQLKRGQTQSALDSLLKAGVMEPRYARAHVHAAVAYYQLGDVPQALGELKRAEALDDKDPLPHFLAAMIETDRLRPADAIDSARAALLRMPYLKSLNQLANDQQGSANLGQAFAFFGMEDWAASYAQESYTPFWAGSHLFLADRYIGLFTKNAELFQGLLSDPTVFGAGNRFKPLVAAPGMHAGLSMRYTRSDDVDGWSPQAELSGYRAEPKPMAWYLGYEKIDWDRFDRPFDLDTFTAAFGIKPSHDLGVFVFADASRQDSQPFSTSGFTYDLDDRLDTRRVDIGAAYKRRPDDQVWFKFGYFKSDEDFSGTQGSDSIVAGTRVEVPELALRRSFDTVGGHHVSFGLDAGRRMTDARIEDDFFLRRDYRVTESSLDLYLTDRLQLNDTLELDAGLFWQRQRRHASEQPYITLFDPPEPGTPTEERRDATQLNPRLGLVWRPDATRRLRLAYQDWLRPTTFSSLQPVATAGIPLDDRLVMRGGDLQRLRLQGEWEANASTFLSAHADYKDIDNRLLGIRPPSVSDLESLGKLRPRDFGSLMRDDLYEVADTPDYAGGKIASVGLGLNRLLSREWALNLRYVWTDSENRADKSLDVPYLPKQAFAVGATWIQESGWYVAGRLAWRDARYQDEANTLRLDSGWSGDIDVFKESRDKRWMFRFSANNLFGDAPEQVTAEINYRF